MKALSAVTVLLALAACSPPTEAEIAEAAAQMEIQKTVYAVRDAERRLKEAKTPDLGRPLYLTPGAPLCPDKREVEMALTDAPNRCLTAPTSVEAHFVGSGIVAMTMAYQVRVPYPDGTGFGEFWVPDGGVTNDVDELVAAVKALNAARAAERTALAPKTAPATPPAEDTRAR